MWRRLLCCILVLLVASTHAQARLFHFIDDTPIKKDPATVAKDWKNLENLLKTLINQATETLMPIVMDNVHDVNITSTCVRDATHVFVGIRKLQIWALRFVDSSAKSVDGVLSGNLFSYGAYDECLDTVAINQHPRSHEKEEEEEVLFTGKYCTVRIKLPLSTMYTSHKEGGIQKGHKNDYGNETIIDSMESFAGFSASPTLRLGLCIPSGCSVDDINEILSKLSNSTSLLIDVKRCEVKEGTEFTPLLIAVISVYSFVGFVVLLGTAAEVYSLYFETKLKNKSLQVLVIFSVISNFRKLMDTSSSSKYLPFLNGIRFFSMAWIVLGHSYLIPFFDHVGGLLYLTDMIKEFAFQTILNATLSVETFFFLSGFLVCYVATQHVKIRKREFSVKVYILHRIVRILPGYIFAICLMFLSETMLSGPTAHSVLPFIEACKENWWTNLLFINNFYQVDNMCLPHTWYLAADMQMYIGALIILLPMFRWPKLGISIAVVCLISSLVTAGAITYIRDYPAFGVIDADLNIEKVIDYLLDFYFTPYPHVTSYVLGIATGYLLATYPTLKIPKVLLWFGWPFAIACSLLAVFGIYPWNLGKEMTPVEIIMYGSLHRFAWIVGIAWIVICCATGYGGIFNYVLSRKIWIPLGRLTFIVYLVHVVIQIIFYDGMRNTFHAMHSMFIWLFFGHLAVSYAVAFVGTMLIQSPLITVEQILLSRYGKERMKKSENDSIIRETMNENNMGSLNGSPSMEQSCNGTRNPEVVVSIQ